MGFHRGTGSSFHRLRVAFLLLGAPFCDRPAGGKVTVDRVMRRGLVGHDIRPHAATNKFRENVGGIAEQADRFCLSRLRPLVDQGEGLVQRVGFGIDVTRAQAEIDAVSSHSTARQHAPAMTAASGWAPPMPPRPPVRIHLPFRFPP